MTLLVKDGGDTTNVAQAALNSADWTKYTIKFNSGDYTSIYVSIMGGKAGASAIVDSAVLVKGSNNLLQNGDFETGNTTGWTNLYNLCTLSMTSGHTGSYGLRFVLNLAGHAIQLQHPRGIPLLQGGLSDQFLRKIKPKVGSFQYLISF